jgi:hypothetical protein
VRRLVERRLPGPTDTARILTAPVKQMTDEPCGVPYVLTAVDGKELDQEPDAVGTCSRGFGAAAESNREFLVAPRILSDEVQCGQGSAPPMLVHWLIMPTSVTGCPRMGEDVLALAIPPAVGI